MSDQITDEQRAAWARLTFPPDPVLLRLVEGPALWDDIALIAPLLPVDLTAPHQIPPTEPGAYQCDTGAWFVLTLSGKWLTSFGDLVRAEQLPLPLAPLVPARAPLTVDTLLAKWRSIGFASEETRRALAEAAVDLVNGDDQ